MNYVPLTKDQKEHVTRLLARGVSEVLRLEKAIEITEAMKILYEDKNFKKVFTEFYFKEEILRTAKLLPEEAFLEEKQRISLQDSIIAMAYTNDWVESQLTLGATYAKKLEEAVAGVKANEDFLSMGVPVVDEELVLPPEGE